MSLEVAYTQHQGNNPSQQDALFQSQRVFQRGNLLPEVISCPDAQRNIFALAGGVAVSPEPHRASRIALESLMLEACTTKQVTANTIRRVHQLLCERLARGNTRGSSTTIVVADCCGGRCHVASVGDSRIYRGSSTGAWQQITRDHTAWNAMIDSGEVDEGVKYASSYNSLEACLTADSEEYDFPVFTAFTELQVGDSLLLCTDGVYEELGDAKLRQLWEPELDEVSQVSLWRKSILSTGADDNFSMIWLRRK